MWTSGRKLIALAAMLAGVNANGRTSLNSTGVTPPQRPTRGPLDARGGAKLADEHGVNDEAGALSGDTMFALIAMCREREWVLSNDHAGMAKEEGVDRYALTMSAGAAEGGGGDGGHEGEKMWECTAGPLRCALTAIAAMQAFA